MKKLSPATKYVLKALIPYSKANLMLTFRPNNFFHELSKLDKRDYSAYKSAYYRAIKNGLVVLDADNIPRLTEKGHNEIQEYKPTKLGKDAYLVVIFDIPEDKRENRNHLRSLLKELSFSKIQQSVWASRYDHRELLKAEISEYGLQDDVIVYEALKLDI